MQRPFYAVIMAGGGGTRLWPLSRQARPKQMLPLLDERSLFQAAVDRLTELFPPERILVVTVAAQAAELQRQTPQIPAENFLLEPAPKGTAAVVGLAAAALFARDPAAVMAVLTADHFIENGTHFLDLLRAAYAVSQQDYLVTLGITPTFPATGYGYIQQGASLGRFGQSEAYQVVRFREKPDAAAAAAMIAAGGHAWNSGMFVWKVSAIWAEFERQMPALAAELQRIAAAWNTPERAAVVAAIWPTLQPQTIDYGIMEGAQRVAVIPAANLGWSDVGSWDALFDVLPADAAGNRVYNCQHLGLDTSGALVYGQGGPRLIVTIGVQDLIVVDTGDVLLICPSDQAQQVRQVVARLSESGHKGLL